MGEKEDVPYSWGVLAPHCVLVGLSHREGCRWPRWSEGDARGGPWARGPWGRWLYGCEKFPRIVPGLPFHLVGPTSVRGRESLVLPCPFTDGNTEAPRRESVFR